MNKKLLVLLASLICLNACSDDGGDNGKSSCDCKENEKCFENVCYDQNECNPLCTDGQLCKAGQCYVCNDSGCYSAGGNQDPKVCNCKENEKCFENVCYDQNECDPLCGDGQICKAGQCYICTASGCFSVGNKKSCQSKDDCPDGQECGSDGYCKNKEVVDCSPACGDGEKCVDGECKPSDESLLWSLCRSGSTDCTGSLKCLLWAKPSKAMSYKGVQYGTSENANIKMSDIDGRINVDTYNEQNGTDFSGIDIGICSVDCTSDPDACPIGWTCQVIAKADSPYLGEELPFSVNEDDMKDTGFSAVCRPDVSESMAKATGLSKEMCGSDEEKCKAENLIFYKGMCLEPCDVQTNCPLMFYCGVVGNDQTACVPYQNTCGPCADLDGDGQGAGHCSVKGYDCNDDDPNIYYGRELACSDVADANTDLNCNGIIDRFELLGTKDHCKSCTNVCPSSGNQQSEAVCVSDADANWAKTAKTDADIPDFQCDIQCSYGYGDCKKNGKCETSLLNKSARETADPTVVYADSVVDQSNAGRIWGLDDDKDSFIGIDSAKSIEAGRIVLNAENSVICCGNDTTTCYTANGAWKNISIENEENYVSVTTGADKVSSFDRDDHNPEVAPNLNESCDGIDNDGSTILVSPENLSKLPSCDDYCNQTGVDCNAEGIRVKCFDSECDNIKTVTINGNQYHYAYNAKCDATPDGYNETNPYVDPVESGKNYLYGDKCKIYNQSGDICNEDSAIIACINRDSNYALACVSTEATEQKDGIVTEGGVTSYVFDNIDDNCNGLVDEDAMQPCLIVADMPYKDYTEGSTLKTGYSNGVDNTNCTGGTNCNYIIPASDDSYPNKSSLNGSKLANLDKSISLCRIGVLQAGKEILDGSGQGTGTYEPKCVPLYQPRDYDFFGDGIDSNCDGADYDTAHAVFVSPIGDGSGQTGSNEATCKFDSEKNMVYSPCSYLDKKYDDSNNVVTNGAIAKAAHGGNAENTTLALYSDILIADNQSMVLPITVPVLENPSKVNQFEKFKSDKEEGHILSPFELHKKFVEQLQKTGVNSSNHYLFSFDKKIVDPVYHKTTYEENTDYPIEKNQPDEVIRIYGGFMRSQDNATNNPEKKDIWVQSGTSTVKYEADTKDMKNDETIAMFRPASAKAKLSLKLDHLDIEMAPTAELPPAAVNGVSFIGIDGSAGISNLTLNDSTLSVTGANGYSYTEQPQMPVREYVTYDTYTSDLIYILMNYGSYYYSSDYISTNTTGGESDYNNIVKTSFESDVQHYVGFGGYSRNCNKNESYSNSSGMDGYNNNHYTGPFDKVANGGKGANGNSQLSTDRPSYAYFMFSYDKDSSTACGMRYEDVTGAPGQTGASGANGVSDDIAFEFLKQNNEFSTLYLDTNRSQSMGKVGQHGGGGGAGAVKSCKNYQLFYPTENLIIRNAGALGGRSGRAGMTGGTGASAFGIVARSISTDTLTHIHLNGSSSVSVHSGDSGKPQLGQNGQMGMWPFYESMVYCKNDHCQDNGAYYLASPGGPGGGGGAGGAGAGGRAGLAFPILASCSVDNMQFAKSSEKCSNAEHPELCLDNNDYNTIKNCGFDFNDDFINAMNSKLTSSKGQKWPDLPTYSENIKPIQLSAKTYDQDLPEVANNSSVAQSNSDVSSKYATTMGFKGGSSGAWCNESTRTVMTASGRLSDVFPAAYNKEADNFCLDSDKTELGTECVSRGIKMLIEKDGKILHGPVKEDEPSNDNP